MVCLKESGISAEQHMYQHYDFGVPCFQTVRKYTIHGGYGHQFFPLHNHENPIISLYSHGIPIISRRFFHQNPLAISYICLWKSKISIKNTGWCFQPHWKNISQLGWMFPIYGKKSCSKPPTRNPLSMHIYGTKATRSTALPLLRFSKLSSARGPGNGGRMAQRFFFGAFPSGYVKQ